MVPRARLRAPGAGLTRGPPAPHRRGRGTGLPLSTGLGEAAGARGNPGACCQGAAGARRPPTRTGAVRLAWPVRSSVSI